MVKSMKHEMGNVLIEALIASVIVGTGGLALTKLQSNNNSNSMEGNQTLQATLIARDQIEKTLYSNNASTTAFTNLDGSRTYSESPTATFSTSKTITAVNGTNYKKVAVSVGWTDRENTSQSVTINSGVSQASPDLSGKVASNITPSQIAAPTVNLSNGNGGGKK